MHRPDHAHAEIVEGLDERQILPDRVGVLHALVDDAPARRDDPGGVVGFGRQREIAGVARHHLADFDRALQRLVARGRIAFGRARPLAGVDGEEPAIEPAPHHARIVHLGEVVGVGVVLHHAPAGTAEARGRVEMGVERQEPLVDGVRVGGKRRGRAREDRDRHQTCKACYRCVHVV